MLNIEQIAVSAYLRDAARRQFGPRGEPLQLISMLACIWDCSMPEVIERIRARINRECTLTGDTLEEQK